MPTNRNPVATNCRGRGHENSQRVLDYAQPLIEPGRQGFIGCKLAFSDDHIAFGGRARHTLLAHQLQILLININDILDGLELSADGRS